MNILIGIVCSVHAYVYLCVSACVWKGVMYVSMNGRYAVMQTFSVYYATLESATVGEFGKGKF